MGKVKHNHIMGVLLVLSGLTPFAMASVMAIGWEKTLGCLCVGVALALCSVVIAMGAAVFKGD